MDLYWEILLSTDLLPKHRACEVGAMTEGNIAGFWNIILSHKKQKIIYPLKILLENATILIIKTSKFYLFRLCWRQYRQGS